MHDSERKGNVDRSLQKFISDSLVGATGFPVDYPAANVQWPGVPFDSNGLDYFLQVSPSREIDRTAYNNGGTIQALTLFAVFLNVYMLEEYAIDQNNVHLLTDAHDAVKDVFPEGLGVTVMNYQGDGQTTLGKLWLEEREPNEPADKHYRSNGWLFTFRWEETQS